MPSVVRQKWEGRWDQFVGRVKRLWGSINDDDLATVTGDYERVIGLINERTGENPEEIERRLCDNG